jgi:plasmid stability protein
MAQLIVRNLEETVKAKLQRRAKHHHRSMEEEVRDILRNAADEDEVRGGGLGSEISRLFSRAGLTSEVAELRGHKIKPASFKP